MTPSFQKMASLFTEFMRPLYLAGQHGIKGNAHKILLYTVRFEHGSIATNVDPIVSFTAHERLACSAREQAFLQQFLPLVEEAGLGRLGLGHFTVACHAEKQFPYISCSISHSNVPLPHPKFPQSIQNVFAAFSDAHALLALHQFSSSSNANNKLDCYLINNKTHIYAACPKDALVLYLLEHDQDTLSKLLKGEDNIRAQKPLKITRHISDDGLNDFF